MRMKTKLVQLGSMSLLIEQPEDGFTSFKSQGEWSPMLATLPAEVAEEVQSILLVGYEGSLAQLIADVEGRVNANGTQA